jgi:two-component system nitrogen regulation sensor histidine kinase NtrY
VESIESKEKNVIVKNGKGKNNKDKKGRLKKTVSIGRIEVFVVPSDDQVEVIIEDSGGGFPKQSRETLTEPYVTTRDKGTGLGLAIVRKIMEDHQGTLALEDHAKGGARVRLILPLGNKILSAGSNKLKTGNQTDSLEDSHSQSTESAHGK